jgi:Thiamine pyrophosphate enzyme, C-terminal TPP binding domain
MKARRPAAVFSICSQHRAASSCADRWRDPAGHSSRGGRCGRLSGRKVVCLLGDGGAMYTLQALWTQARESLDVTTVIFANRRWDDYRRPEFSWFLISEFS